MAQKSKQLRSSSRLLALEPRLLFDGAAMVAAQDAIRPYDAHQSETASHASEKTSEHVSEQKQLDFDGSFASINAVNVVVIDSRVPQLDELVADLKAGGAQVHVVQANESGLPPSATPWPKHKTPTACTSSATAPAAASHWAQTPSTAAHCKRTVRRCKTGLTT